MTGFTANFRYQLWQKIPITRNLEFTRNTHAHLCLTPVHRLCTHVICGCRWGARGTCYIYCRPRRSCLVLVGPKLRWPHHAIIPNLHLQRQRTLSSTHLSESSISECVRLCNAHNYGLYIWYVTTFHVTFLRMTHHVRTYILSENRSSIQSLALMHSAINSVIDIYNYGFNSKPFIVVT